MATRLLALIIKELLVVLRDPRSRIILVGPPLIQLIIFAFAATLEVKHVDLVALNNDEGQAGRELLQRVAGAPTVKSLRLVESPGALRDAIDQGWALGALQIGPTFSRDVAAGRAASVQVVLDGRRSNASQILESYLGTIVEGFVGEQNALHHRVLTAPQVVPRNWFNSNLTYTWYTVPGLIAIVGQLIGLIVTALSVARERELGTFDQLLVSPLRTMEILIGKTLPPLIIGLVLVSLYILATVLVFQVPLRGSLVILYASAVWFLAAVVGVGLFISALSATQQQAILGAILFIAPATLLSGFATPIENMPDWLQPVTLLNPLRYFLVVVRGVFLKASPPSEVFHDSLPLVLIALLTLASAGWLFRRRME
jgi:ABC-2 type transport system permease protein